VEPDREHHILSRIKELERENARLRQELERAQQRVRELERLIEELRRGGKRQAAPFSKGPPKLDPRTPGRKPGEEYGQRAFRPIPERVDETIEVPLPRTCPDCGGAVKEEGVEDQYQEDIPEMRPWVRRFRIHVGRCQRCRGRVQGRHRLQTSDAVGAAKVQLGPRAVAVGAQMNKELGVPLGKVAAIFEVAFQFPVSRGGLCRAIERLGDKAGPTYDALKGAVARSEVVTPDETGWKRGGWLVWLWVFATPEVTVYAILPGRGWEEAASVLGEDYEGVLVRDGWAPYRKFERAEHQSCLAHLLSRCKEMEEGESRAAGDLAWAVKRSLQGALALRDRWEEGEISFHGLQVARGRLEAGFDRLLERRCLNPAKRRLVRHLENERPHLFTFLRKPGVEATNWRAEQALRPAVVTRKVCGGNRTWKGAYTQAVLASVFRTCRQQGRDPHRLLVKLLQAPRPRVLGLIPSGPGPPA